MASLHVPDNDTKTLVVRLIIINKEQRLHHSNHSNCKTIGGSSWEVETFLLICTESLSSLQYMQKKQNKLSKLFTSAPITILILNKEKRGEQQYQKKKKTNANRFLTFTYIEKNQLRTTAPDSLNSNEFPEIDRRN